MCCLLSSVDAVLRDFQLLKSLYCSFHPTCLLSELQADADIEAGSSVCTSQTACHDMPFVFQYGQNCEITDVEAES